MFKHKFNSKKLLVIRLYKAKKIKWYATYKIVVVYKHQGQKSAFLSQVGFYSPMALEKRAFIDTLGLGMWLNKGAFLSKKASFLLGFLSVVQKKLI